MKDNSITVYIIIILSLGSCKTKQIFTDPRDGQQYPYIEHNNIRWLTENMRYHLEGSKWNKNSPDTLYGRLYNGFQALSVCPDGWTLSSSFDWMSLESTTLILERGEIILKDRFRGKNINILKSKKGWSNRGTDSLSFKILPAGIYTDYDQFTQLNKGAFFWTSSLHSINGHKVNDIALFRYINNDSTGIYLGNHWKYNHYMSCRCVQHIK